MGLTRTQILENLTTWLDYNPQTGQITYRVDYKEKKAGENAINQIGRNTWGVYLERKSFSVTKVAWVLSRGEIPDGAVTTRDGNTLNLKPENLILKSKIYEVVLTQEELRSLIRYDEGTGEVTWLRKSPQAKGTKGKGSFGRENKRFRRINAELFGVARPLTHFIWYYMVGEFPPIGFVIDHKDRDSMNNAWSNLRLATYSENQANTSDSERLGGQLRGVIRAGKLFKAICIRKKRRYIGPKRVTAEEAHEDYRELHKKLYAEFSIY